MTGNPVKTTRRGFKTKKEAQLELNRLLVDFEKEDFKRKNEKQIKTFKDLYQLWFEQHSRDVKQTTIQRIQSHFDNHILPKLGNKNITSITPLYCQKCLNEWSETLISYKQLRVYSSKVFKYGILIGLIDVNPMDRTITPKQKKNSTKQESDSFYTREELKQFFECLEQLEDKRAYAFFRVLAFLGLRKGEAMALTWKDIDFKNNKVTINKTLVELHSGKMIVQSTKTESSSRTITMDQQTANILREWKNHVIQEKFALGIRDENTLDNVVFCSNWYSHDNQYLYKAYANNVMKKVQRNFPDMKIIRVHDFRKTNASLLFEAGASIKDVAQRLGHKSTKTTTDIYVKVTPAKQNETAEMFAKYMAF